MYFRKGSWGPCFFCFFFISSVVHSSLVPKLAEIFVDKIRLKRALVQIGLDGQASSLLVSGVDNAFRALGIQYLSGADLIRSLHKIEAKGEGLHLKNRLLLALSDDVKNVDPDSFRNLINEILLFSTQYGKNREYFLSCSVCVDNSLRKEGFFYTLEKIKSPQIKLAMKRFPSSVRGRYEYLATASRGMGSYQGAMEKLEESDRVGLGVMFELKKIGTPSEVSLVNEIIEFSKNVKGEVDLYKNESKHRLWQLFNANLSPAQTSLWAQYLGEVNQTYRKWPTKNRREIFFAGLNKRADGDGEKLSKVERVQENGCFFW